MRAAPRSTVAAEIFSHWLQNYKYSRCLSVLVLLSSNVSRSTFAIDRRFFNQNFSFAFLLSFVGARETLRVKWCNILFVLGPVLRVIRRRRRSGRARENLIANSHSDFNEFSASWATFHRSRCKRIFFFVIRHLCAVKFNIFSGVRASHIFRHQNATMMLDSWKLNFNFNSKLLVQRGCANECWQFSMTTKLPKKKKKKKRVTNWRIGKSRKKIFYLFSHVRVRNSLVDWTFSGENVYAPLTLLVRFGFLLWNEKRTNEYIPGPLRRLCWRVKWTLDFCEIPIFRLVIVVVAVMFFSLSLSTFSSVI